MKALQVLRDPTVSAFRTSFFAPEIPCCFPNRYFRDRLPAISTWFHQSKSNIKRPYLEKRIKSPFKSVSVETSTSNGVFERKDIPLTVFLQYLAMQHPPKTLPKMYLAQEPLLDTFPELRPSFEPIPEFVTLTGKGDIYATNLWLGRSNMINSPLHKDPNPNLFVQMCGKKKVRIFEPEVGRRLLLDVDPTGVSLSAFRGQDMMVGEQMDAIDDQVWNKSEEGYEAGVRSGDAIFIPTGWWHAVRGVGNDVNGSVNWWFR